MIIDAMKPRTFAFVTTMVILLLAGCGGPPSSSDGRQQLENRIQNQSNGLIKLTSFEKTNGVAQELMGMKFYEMEYSAEIEFLDDCMWGGGGPFGWDGSFQAVRGQPGTGADAFNPTFFGKQKASKGQLRKVTGKFTFQKTEAGWRLAQ
jgi:hypothetical protein